MFKKKGTLGNKLIGLLQWCLAHPGMSGEVVHPDGVFTMVFTPKEAADKGTEGTRER